jgi:hypothetical protein
MRSLTCGIVGCFGVAGSLMRSPAPTVLIGDIKQNFQSRRFDVFSQMSDPIRGSDFRSLVMQVDQTMHFRQHESHPVIHTV